MIVHDRTRLTVTLTRFFVHTEVHIQMKKLLAALLCLMLVLPAAAEEPEYVVRYGDRAQHRIAITVDDCYNLDNVRAIFDLCKEYGVPMTFFVCGTSMMVEHRGLWTEIIDFGCEIGNHTYGHKNLAEANNTSIRYQILRNQQALDTVLGYHYEMQVFRPPYGKWNRYVREIVQEYGYEKLVLWDVDSTNAKKAYRGTQDGSILIFHANKADVKCLTTIVPQLVADGYEFVTVSDMFGLGPIETSPMLYMYDSKTRTLVLRPDDEQPYLLNTPEPTPEPEPTPAPTDMDGDGILDIVEEEIAPNG